MFPEGKKFAFTILDDTDDSKVDNAKPIYDFLYESGMRTTKTVWAFDADDKRKGPYFAAETLDSPGYLEWVQDLETKGFEIAFHNATMGTSIREDTIKAVSVINESLNKPMTLHCNHGQNLENLYWGEKRYSSPILRGLYKLISRCNREYVYQGEDPRSKYYWADIAKNNFRYMRSLTFNRLDCANIPPYGVYSDPKKENIPKLFNTSDAPDIYAFNSLVNKSSIDNLYKNQGWAIISTHLGKHFYKCGKINKDFKQNIDYLATLPGWFVPASDLLDHILTKSSLITLNTRITLRMELLHLIDRIAFTLTKSAKY